MPVRIVRDNPDEESLSENFNFDNPNETNNGGYDEQQNNNQQTSGGGLDLGSLANMLFGGGGSVGGGSSSNNSVFGSLVSVAIGAAVNYAVNHFQNSNSRGSYNSAAPSAQNAEDLLQARMQAASMAVSIWSYSVGADRDFQPQEKQVIQNLIQSTIDQLFPSNIANQDLVNQELTQIFNSPMPYEEVVGQARQNGAFALQLYQQAALIIAADGNYEGREQSFLTDLTNDLGLAAQEVRNINQQYGL